jgi:hypothetical protein
MNSYATIVQLQKASPRFAIPFTTISKLDLKVGEEVTCNFWGENGVITGFKTKVPASREVHVPAESAKLLHKPSRIYFVEVCR